MYIFIYIVYQLKHFKMQNVCMDGACKTFGVIVILLNTK